MHFSVWMHNHNTLIVSLTMLFHKTLNTKQYHTHKFGVKSSYCMRSHQLVVLEAGNEEELPPSPWENKGLNVALDQSAAGSRPAAPASAWSMGCIWSGSCSAMAMTLGSASDATDGSGCDNNDTDMRRTQLTAGTGAVWEPTSNGTGRTGTGAGAGTRAGGGVAALALEVESPAPIGALITSGKDECTAEPEETDMRRIQLAAGVGAMLAPTGNGAGKCNGNELRPFLEPESETGKSGSKGKGPGVGVAIDDAKCKGSDRK
jgi:hypothetical protein